MLAALGIAVGIGVLAGWASTGSSWTTVEANKRLDRHVSVDEKLGVFLVERGRRIIAFSAHGPWNNEPLIYCASSHEFEGPRSGAKFDLYGHYFAGPAPRGMTRFPVRTEGGDVQVLLNEAIPGPGRRASLKRVLQPVGPFCIPW